VTVGGGSPGARGAIDNRADRGLKGADPVLDIARRDTLVREMREARAVEQRANLRGGRPAKTAAEKRLRA
jgi:hypothetical protein